MKGRIAKPRLQEIEPANRVQPPSEAELQSWIAEAAYYRAERRGFQPGSEIEDWLAAEAETRQRLQARERPN
jgi:hypothetical protein